MAFTRPYILPYTDTLLYTHSNVKEDQSKIKISLENHFSDVVLPALSNDKWLRDAVFAFLVNKTVCFSFISSFSWNSFCITSHLCISTIHFKFILWCALLDRIHNTQYTLLRFLHIWRVIIIIQNECKRLRIGSHTKALPNHTFYGACCKYYKYLKLISFSSWSSHCIHFVYDVISNIIYGHQSTFMYKVCVLA